VWLQPALTRFNSATRFHVCAWANLVSHLLWAQVIGGSNPPAQTTFSWEMIHV
jgi:hypothetical protein